MTSSDEMTLPAARGGGGARGWGGNQTTDVINLNLNVERS